jgi:methionine-rich copper-binding protein CopC
VAAIFTALLISSALTVGAGAANAHTELTGSVPPAGAELDRAPRTLNLLLDEELESASVQVTDGCGQAVTAMAEVDGSRVDVMVGGGGQGGSWTVRWLAVGRDGHPVEGDLRFTVNGPAECAGQAAPAARASVAPARPGVPLVPVGAALAVFGVAVFGVLRRGGGAGR